MLRYRIEQKIITSDVYIADIRIDYQGKKKTVNGVGNGPIGTVKNAIRKIINQPLKVLVHHEHLIIDGSGVSTVCYIEFKQESAR